MEKLNFETSQMYISDYVSETGNKIQAIRWTGKAESTLRIGHFLNVKIQIDSDGLLIIPVWYGSLWARIGHWIAVINNEVHSIDDEMFVRSFNPIKEDNLKQEDKYSKPLP